MDTSFALALSYDDVLLRPLYSDISSRLDVDLTTTLAPGFTFKLPIVSTKMDTVTGVEMAIAMGKLGGFGILPRFEAPELQTEKVAKVKKENIPVAAAVGVKEGFLEHAEMLVNAGATILNVDVAHGHMKKTIDATRTLKQIFGKDILIISGIAATKECAEDLYKAGADCLLVGVGASPICITRVQTGCGLPGFASLLEVAPVAKKHKKTFLPDAGMRTSGDIVKALATGASGAVCGFIFAGTNEAPGKLVEKDGVKYKEYNGSASEKEKVKHVQKYSRDKGINYTIQIEGVSSLVPYKGPVKDVVETLKAGIRSGLSYCGARNIHELHKKAQFVQITPAGVRESNPHDVIVTKQ